MVRQTVNFFPDFYLILGYCRCQRHIKKQMRMKISIRFEPSNALQVTFSFLKIIHTLRYVKEVLIKKPREKENKRKKVN